LFDMEGFTKNLERAYKRIYDRHKKKLKPANITINE